ncbi:MAG: DegT/DnrJ/EryC1/StrS family aminotransferase [Planctomycetota bacterium]
MWTRMRLDIGWRDLFAGLSYCLKPTGRSRAEDEATRAWSRDDDCVISLSVRSAFDLLLRSLELRPGSEVLMSALTVPDMIRIVREHGLVPVPVDIQDDGQLDIAGLRLAITPRSQLLVVAHLFGGTTCMDEVIPLAREHGLLVVEDCAQSFRDVGDRGHPDSDVAMFSFGPIKTATAIGGAVARVSDREICAKMRRQLIGDPVQSRFAFAKRLVRFATIKWLCGPRASRCFAYCARCLGYDFDSLANSFAKGFKPTHLLLQIRRRPSVPLLELLRRRWQSYDGSRIERRIEHGKKVDQRLGQQHPSGHSYWVYPLFVNDPPALCRRLQAFGYDATHRSRMAIVDGDQPTKRATLTEARWRRVVFLPWSPDMPDEAIDEMAGLVRHHLEASRPIPGPTNAPDSTYPARNSPAIT